MSDVKAYFLHIPKTGGKSVKSIITRYNHLRYIGHEKITQKLPAYTFCMVRNPFARTLSTYKYLLQGGEPNRWDAKDKEIFIDPYGPGDFKKFVRERLQIAVHFQQHFRPMTHYMINEDFWIVDRFYKLENIENNWEDICKKIEIPFQPLPHVNSSNSGNYRDHYDDETRAIVARLYAADLEKFDYEF